MQTQEAEIVSKMQLDVIAEQIYTHDGKHCGKRIGFDEAGGLWSDYGRGREKQTLLEVVDSLRLMEGSSASRNTPTFDPDARARFWKMLATALQDGSPQNRGWSFESELYRIQHLVFGLEVTLRKILFSEEQCDAQVAGGFIVEMLEFCSDCARHMMIGFDDLNPKKKSPKVLEQVRLLNKLVRGLQMAADQLYGDSMTGRIIDDGAENFSDGFLLYQAEQIVQCAKRIDVFFHE